uniref:Uncharacterized protein n=1 Tax=Oncorhynchus tshawytscha TaxID=74940 RepID=A0AAZ3PJC0_ONCTS
MSLFGVISVISHIIVTCGCLGYYESYLLTFYTKQFKKSPPKVPYKAIALATFLFLIGSLLIVIGALLLAGSIEVSVSSSQTYVHYIAKSTRAPARQTSHYKIMAINMELVPPFVLQVRLSTRCWNIAAGTCFHSATGISEVGH